MRPSSFEESTLIVLALCACCGCALNPATGEHQLSLVSEAGEIQLGRQAGQQVEQTLGFVDRPELQAYVGRIGRELASASERPNLPWEFHVVDDPTPNAFALPGGFIYVTRGMMDLLTSEAELASVLGHEIAHATARHAVNLISRQQLAQLGLGLGSVFVPGVEGASSLIGTGLDLLFLKYSRDDEREADELGFEYVQQQHYDVSEFADVFATLRRLEDRDHSGLPDWMSTHPATVERVTAASARAAKVTQSNPRIGRDTYLREIDGLAYGINPRHGYFTDNVFSHPDLGFTIQFPRGWNTRNLAQAVVGAAPEGSAAIELTLSKAGTSDEAVRQFGAIQGVSVGAPWRQAFNGLDGVSTQFVADTPEGRLRGVAAFVQQNGHVFQLVGYGPASSYGVTAPVLNRALESFAPVTDPSVLRIAPTQIDIVQLQGQQTLGQFARRYPSTVSIDELALLNHLADETASLQAGTLVKRVVS